MSSRRPIVVKTTTRKKNTSNYRKNSLIDRGNSIFWLGYSNFLFNFSHMNGFGHICVYNICLLRLRICSNLLIQNNTILMKITNGWKPCCRMRSRFTPWFSIIIPRELYPLHSLHLHLCLLPEKGILENKL